MSKKLQQISVPLISVFLGILLGAIVMWIFGYDAIWGYEELFYTAFGSLRGIGEIFRAMGPLVLIGLGFAVASRAGFFNVGLPGQALAGWILSGWFALSNPDMPRLVLIPLTVIIALIAGGIVGAIVMWIFGYDAIWGYEELFYTAFGSLRGVGEIFRAMGPLVLIGLGFAVASRAGFFNVGLPGQALAGWILSGWFALSNPDMPRLILIPLTVIIALIAGGIVGAIPGILRAYLGTSEVIVTIMMNYIVLYVGNAFIHAFPKDIMQSTDSTIRVSANATYQTQWLSELTGNSRMNIGIFFAIIAVGVIWFLLKKTTLGFEIRAVGLNPNASEYAGISAKRTIILSMIISGALAGLGGAVEGLGTFQNVYVQGSSLAIGFNGMAVSLLASNSPIGILFAAFLFGVLQVGAPGMNTAQVPSELVSIVTASIIFFVSVHYLIERFVKPKKQVKGGK